jgi:putative ABC transport system permease protein
MGTSIIILFSLIITLVSLIVIRFRIRNSIEEDIFNIGALKAIGYTSRQLISSILLQFTGTAFIGALMGGAFTVAALPALKAAFSVQTGIIWDQGFDAKSFLITLIFIILVTVLVSLLSANRIRKLVPITALRNGINTHNFRKNHFPLEKTAGNLNFILSIKVMIQNIRQNIAVVVIIAAVCLTSVFALVMYYNIAYDDKAFADTITGEYSTAVVMLDSQNYNEDIIKNISKMPEVRKVIYYDRVSALYNNTEAFKVYVTDDYSLTENKKCYEGTDPIHDNEIALNGYMAEMTGKKIGDTIKIKFGNNSFEYLITGFMQTANGSDYDSEMTTAGYRHIYPDFKPLSLYIYLKDGNNAAAFLDNIRENYGKYMRSFMNAMKMKESMLSVFVKVVTIMAYVIIFITFLIIVLVLFLIIKTLIIKQKRYLGISKALGFTTSQLVFQISLGFVPVALIGSIIGGLAGYFGINPIMSLGMRSMGIMKMKMIIPPEMLVILCSVICIFTFVIATLVSTRIRKISAVSLITE